MTAYILEPPRQMYDLSSLYEKYKIVPIIPSKVDAMVLRDDPWRLRSYVYGWAFENFKSGEDFFILTGNLTAVTIAAMAIQDAIHGPPRLLVYNSDAKAYSEVLESREPAKNVG